MALVRLNTYLPRQGNVLRSLTVKGYRFVESRGWYEVDDAVAEELRDIPQQDRYPHGPKAFLIAKDAEDAKRLDYEALAGIRRLQGEESSVGTAEAPVKASPKRPGAARSTAPAEDGADSAPAPRTRRRKSE